MSLPKIPTSLSKNIEKDNLVIFIGAGLSVKAGLPNWKKLTIKVLEGLKERDDRIEKYIDILNDELNLFDPIEILGKIEHLRNYAFDILEEEIRSYDAIQPTIVHKKILNICSRIVTTNYDKLLEESDSSFEKITYTNTFKVSKMAGYPKTIFKIHGDINEPDKYIFFPKDYEDLYSKEEKISTFELKKIFSDRSILFIGFSLTDPYINSIMGYISKLYSNSTREHFIITTDQNKDWPQSITPIKLDDISQLDGFIENLYALTKVKHRDETSPRVPDSLDQNEQILYNSCNRKRITFDFTSREGHVYIKVGDKDVPSEEIGKGKLTFEDNILNVERANIGGRYEIWLEKYWINGEQETYIPQNTIKKGIKNLQISLKTKVIGGSHRLIFTFKGLRFQQILARKDRVITSQDWIECVDYFLVDASEDFKLRIDDINLDNPNSSIQIKDVILTEFFD